MRCRICSGVTQPSYILHSRRYSIDVPTFRCSTCDAYFSAGGPADYQADLRAYYQRYAIAIRRRYSKVFAFVETFMPAGRFMDIGAGMGYSLEVARDRGWSASGLEPNKVLAEDAKARDLDVRNAYLGPDTQGAFDLVLIDNVLEHIPDPQSFLSNAAKLLAPRGNLLVAIPPFDWLRRMLGAVRYVRDRVDRPQLNVFVEVDEHVNVFGRRGMGRLAREVGLRVLDVRFHHSRVFNNTIARGLAIDDGYYLLTRTAASRQCSLPS